MGASLEVEVWQYAADLDPAVNRKALDRITPMTGADLIVLPEAFARDFGEPGSPLAPYAEPLDGPFVEALQAAAVRSGATVIGGMFETSSDPDRPYNTLVAAGGENLSTYRKIHLYDSFGQRESDVVTPGPLEPTLLDIAGTSVGLLTCYDLRFPEAARALSAAGAEIIVLPAAWVAGDRKVDQWRTLLRARAIENICWVVAAAQPGPRYCGHSMVVAPTGDVVVESGEGVEWITATVELDAVADARRRNPSLQNRRL
jgi:predicted amidohydrolase